MRFIKAEIDADGFVRLIWQRSDGGIHMQGIPPDESPDMHLQAVNDDMRQRGLSVMVESEMQQLSAICRAEQTPQRIAAYKARKQDNLSRIGERNTNVR